MKEKENNKERLIDLYLGGSISLPKEKYEMRYEKIENESILLSNKLKLIKKEIKGKEKILKELNEIDPSQELISDSKNDRFNSENFTNR